MPDVIDQFAASYFTLNSISKQRAERTLVGLRRYQGVLGELPIEQASDGELRQYLVTLLEGGMKASTVAWHMRMITPFYGWCWQEGVIDAEHLMRIRQVKPPRGANNRTPRPYSTRELERMWAELDARYPRLPPIPEKGAGRHRLNRWRKGTCNFRWVKKHIMRVELEAIIELALVCGLRRVEIFRLSIDDAHWDNKYIVVHGKRVDQHDKSREVPYPDSTREVMREWFRLRGYMNATTDSLWLSVTGPDPTAPMTFERLAELLHSFGKDWTLHRLRHTCATERLRAGMSMHTLQRFLGHANIQETLRYAKLVNGDVHKAAEEIDADFQRAVKPSRGA